MKATDELTSYYAELLDGSYDCVDRIVLNAYYTMGHGPSNGPLKWRWATDMVASTVGQ